jgi:hypothetical protein
MEEYEVRKELNEIKEKEIEMKRKELLNSVNIKNEKELEKERKIEMNFNLSGDSVMQSFNEKKSEVFKFLNQINLNTNNILSHLKVLTIFREKRIN